ncbi:AP-like endonuclease reverse transcriptase, partial [Brachionus plicatilis]
DIMSIQEVKLTQEEVNVFIRFSGYSTYYKPRQVNPSFGGGVLVLVKNKIGHNEISNFAVSVDHLGIKIDSNGLKLHLVSLYAPVNTLDLNLMKSYCKLEGEVLIARDLNAKTPVVGCGSLDANGRVLEEALVSDLDLCVLNEPNKPTYFKFNNSYSEILDLFLCSTSLANKMKSIQVLADIKMGSDHAPVMCTFSISSPFFLGTVDPEPRFNFSKADWGLYGSSLNNMIESLNVGNSCEIGELDELFSRIVGSAADGAIPKFSNRQLKSYPSSIVELIKERRV